MRTSELRQPDGTLPARTTLGGYTILYSTRQDNTLCADCAGANDEDHPDDPLVSAETYDEGPTLCCDGCGADIESSYGDPADLES